MPEKSLSRFSISMAGDLVQQLDEMTRDKGYPNRSHAIAEMVRDRLIEYRSQIGEHEAAGTITLVYDHHKRNIQAHLTSIAHDHEDLVISAMHVHLDHYNCMETLAVRGRADRIRIFADKLIAIKGVKHGKMTFTTTGKEFI